MNERATILIVDDDAGGRESLKGVLLTQGYQLIEAENGREAIEKALAYIPDLILLDVMMPGMDGYEVCRILRSDRVLGEIPIVLITALDDRDSRIEGIEAGADDFISKPYDRVELRARVRTITRLNRYRHLLLERARFVWVVDNDQDAYLMLDEHDEINYANAAARTLFNLPDDESAAHLGNFKARIQTGYVCIPPHLWADWPDVKDAESPLYLIRQPDEQSQQVWLDVNVLDLPWVTKKQRLLRIRDITKTMALTLETWSFHSAANHKLITPLSNIILSIELMRLLLKTEQYQELGECVDGIEEGAHRLESEIKDVLQYINAPSFTGSGEWFELSALDPLLKETAKELSIDPINFMTADPSLLCRQIPLSQRALQTILWELFENSKKFHPSLTPSIEVVIAAKQPGCLMLTFRDNGMSLPPDYISNALLPYFQGEKVYSGEISGMGLGLPTIAAMVWQVGGDIRLYNLQGQSGVAVEIQLPYR